MMIWKPFPNLDLMCWGPPCWQMVIINVHWCKTDFGQHNIPQRKLIIIESLRSCDPPKHWKLPRTIMANLAMIQMSMIIIIKWSCELRWEREIKKDNVYGISKPGIDLKSLWLLIVASFKTFPLYSDDGKPVTKCLALLHTVAGQNDWGAWPGRTQLSDAKPKGWKTLRKSEKTSHKKLSTGNQPSDGVDGLPHLAPGGRVHPSRRLVQQHHLRPGEK